MNRRSAGPAIIALGILSLAACSPLPLDTAGATRVDGAAGGVTRSPSPSAGASRAAPTAVDLSFGHEEEQVANDWVVGWLIPFEGDVRFAPVAQEEWTNQGGYTHQDAENGCVIRMHVLRVADEELLADDSALSDIALATLASGDEPSPEDVELMGAYAVDDAIRQDVEGKTVEFRVWQHSSQGESLLHAARVFGAMGAGLTLTVTCPAGTAASDEYKRVVRPNAAIAVRWPEAD